MLRFTRALAALAVLSTVLVAVPAAPAAAWEDKTLCHHVTWGGTYYCKYHHEVETLRDGTIYFFVVNVNYQVWTRWRNPNGQFSQWTGLGGHVWHGNPENDGVKDGNPTDIYSQACTNGHLLIGAHGNSGDQYWKARNNAGQWTPTWTNFKSAYPNC